MFSTHWNKIDIKVKASYKDYFLNLLVSKTGQFSLEEIKAIIQCLLIIVKLAWLDDPAFQKIVLELQEFSRISYNHQMIAFIAYDSLIQEMDYYNKSSSFASHLGRSLGQNKRVSMHFKDAALGEILLFSLKSLRSMLGQMQTMLNEQQSGLEMLLQCLKVIKDSLTFDFAGRFDDTLENFSFNQMPGSWSSIIGNSSLLDPVFDVMFKSKLESHQILVAEHLTE
eukprot:TRINITY_DN14218_c0_g1_i3.p1 TRINITY_DN14218_c0_g1~~TRINITY_DN14218_c0_g1_i3.p1  ORF type:complete len:225 (-),score=51.67 TRINITY_DN14218_c0_g1_i3:682-1356(-)